ncbi:hypothetical protein ANCCAN_08198 [Ancylostoma caninum]|uniref:Uncharacterized protein n=1 Tax=Ancylostoma caninum TaxID=29170 RepID=A0A368GR90_ANCCA|nr:hypothetical protein ANCCAN_08198 [Ancylostoma caninum]
MTAFSRSAMSIEGILLKILTEVAEVAEKNDGRNDSLTCHALISLEQLEAHLCKLGLVFDSVLLLRLLLHKLSWDLGLVAKKRVAVVDQTHKSSVDPRAHSSLSLGNNIRFVKKKKALTVRR